MKTYKVIELPQYNKNVLKAMLSLRVATRPLTKPRAGQLLVKMKYAPCNPSDIAFMQGVYGIKKEMPAVLGFEGAGVVEAVGAGVAAEKWLGKLVSCYAQNNQQGTWAAYMLASEDQLMLHDDEMDPQQAACFYINPLTAVGMLEIAQQRDSKAVIMNAAGGQMTRLLAYLLQKNGIERIGIVRKETTKRKLLDMGFVAVLLSTADHFEEELFELAHRYGANTAFDAIAGEASGQVLKAMPNDSELVVYGGLSGKPISDISPIDLIFNNKMLTGFNLNDWLNQISADEFFMAKTQLTSLIRGGVYTTAIQSVVTPEEVIKGLRQYISAMSEGKVLIAF